MAGCQAVMCLHGPIALVTGMPHSFTLPEFYLIHSLQRPLLAPCGSPKQDTDGQSTQSVLRANLLAIKTGVKPHCVDCVSL